MPVKHPHSSNDGLPSFPSRLIHKVSSSFGSFNVKKQALSDREEVGRFPNQHSLRHTTKFCYGETTCNREPAKQCVVSHIDGANDQRLRRSAEQSADCEPCFDRDPHSRRGFRSHTLNSVPELDASPITSGQSRQKPNVIVGGFLDKKVKQIRLDIKSTKKARRESSAACSDMHRLVNSDDYLLARGANPRTGVVTPGSHSAGSSIDRDQNDLSRIGRQIPSSRWRQRGDQWVSLDLDEPTPLSGSLTDRPGEHQYQTLRIPQKLATREERDSLLDHGGVQIDHTLNSAYGPGATVRLRQHPLGASMVADRLQAGVGQDTSRDNIKLNGPIKRKPVGSPPGRGAALPVSHPQRGTNESTDTVRRTPRFNSEVRSFSAPDPLKKHLLPPHSVKKNLPRLPSGGSENGSQTGEDSFLEFPRMDQQVDAPNSKTSNISGPPTLEKELPCLPTNNGLFQSISDLTPYPTSPKEENEAVMTRSPTLHIAAPQGPRGGDPVYPYVRTARPMYPILPATRHIKPVGERVMPIPVYDNPPKHLSPLMRTTGLRFEGPRAMTPREMRVSNRTRQGFDPLSNITTTSTDISISDPRPPRPLRVVPKPQPPDQRMRSRGPRGFCPRPPPSNGTDIIMNTTMKMSTDTMMSIPMPRVRPRAETRPPLPTRANRMYGVPRTGPTCNRSDPIDAEARYPWIQSTRETLAGENHVVPEINLIPQPLKPRLQLFQGPTTVSDIQLEHAERSTSGLGLMRKCSHCNHAYMGVKLHHTDSITPMSVLQRAVDRPNEDTKYLHPKRSPLPGLPQDSAPQQNAETRHEILTHLHKTVDVVDERDHTICCPECCKLDCHEGCLGHPSPTCATSHTKSLWPETQSSTSSSGPSGPEMQEEAKSEKSAEKGKLLRLAAVKSVLKRPPKKEEDSMSGSHIQEALSKAAPVELPKQSPTPVTPSRYSSLKQLPDAVAAALSAMEPFSRKGTKEALTATFSAIGPSERKASAPRPTIHRRQRSSSLPIIGTGVIPCKGSENAQYHRAASGGSRLRVPTPLGFAMSCSKSSKGGSSRSRNVSGASTTTMELQVPSFTSLATCGSYAAIGDVLLIPLEAGKMWIRNHPRILTIGGEMIQRAWIMAQLMMRTGWRLWAMVFVYSKTGKIKFQVSKGETLGGFVLDVARSLLYLVVFVAVSTVAIRILGLVLGLLGMLGWILRTMVWILKAIMGLGR